MRVVLDFEVPNSSLFTWLNTGKFIANRIVDTVAKTIQLNVCGILKAALPDARIQIKDPVNVPNQTWECFQLTGGQGASVFTENAMLGTSISIGASKRKRQYYSHHWRHDEWTRSGQDFQRRCGLSTLRIGREVTLIGSAVSALLLSGCSNNDGYGNPVVNPPIEVTKNEVISNGEAWTEAGKVYRVTCRLFD